MGKKIYKLTRYLIWNAGIAALAYFAVIEQITGAANLLYFVVGGLLAITLLACIPGVIEKTAKNMTEPFTPAVPIAVNYVIDGSLVAFFIWHGWWFTGIALLLSLMLGVMVIALLRDLSQKHIMDILSKQP